MPVKDGLSLACVEIEAAEGSDGCRARTVRSRPGRKRSAMPRHVGRCIGVVAGWLAGWSLSREQKIPKLPSEQVHLPLTDPDLPLH